MEKVPQQTPVYAPIYQQEQEDEIDLFELWSILGQQKILIVVITLLTMMIAVGYLISTRPVYKAEVFFLPPLQQDIQALNLQGMQGMQGMQENTVLSVYMNDMPNWLLETVLFNMVLLGEESREMPP